MADLGVTVADVAPCGANPWRFSASFIATISSREAYRRTFDRLIEHLPERVACRTMVELLSLAHERACEAELSDVLSADLLAGRLPDLAALRRRFAPDPASLPDVIIELVPLAAYDALLGEVAA